MHVNSLLTFATYGAPVIPPGARVLEIAPDGRPSRFQQAVQVPVRWETAELADQVGAWSHTSDPPDFVMPDEYEIPVGDGTFDTVVSGNVGEHVRKLWVWIREVARVTKPGGTVITVTPVSWPYHEAPIDCWRIYPEGMRALCEEAGLRVETSWWGSLERQLSRRTYPGIGQDYDFNPRGWRSQLLGRLGWPMPVAYDHITVARKPG